MLKATFLFICLTLSTRVFAGDDASGPIQYKLDLGAPFTSYVVTDRDRAWVTSLVTRLKYTGEVVYFVRTSLPLVVDWTQLNGVVYAGVEMPQHFYVIPGDAMLKLDERWPYSPGVGGFSMHSPPSGNFIACLNCRRGGVPFLSSSPVLRGLVSWGGRDYKRL